MESMRMFPLGNPLMPFSMVKLRIFEPRYLQMIDECVEQAAPFGIVLIERGFEVGGGDQRSTIGTVAQLVDVTDLPDGELAVVAVGVERIRVLEWLPDDPYPIARVERLGEVVSRAAAARIDQIDRQLRLVLAFVSEAGIDVGPLEYELSTQPEVAAHQLCGLAPVGAYDAQRLLSAPSVDERLELLSAFLEEETEFLRSQLGGS
ncbi:MAG: LON peptidase substrate-binding domain-containing protein [Acidimicrobiia bacterium]|nr:LON peptidase substrate-binding domain-containing protein [Acidimicrobiia bacterium]MDH5502678.1 LON peptidase substrate-binding domain-containing protein [Acidimicrobiia bacterium]